MGNLTNDQIREHNAATVTSIDAYPGVTVSQLRNLLADCPDDAVVVMAADSEGNDFHMFGETGVGWWLPGDREIRNVAGGEPDEDEDEDDVYEPDGTELYAVVLWP